MNLDIDDESSQPSKLDGAFVVRGDGLHPKLQGCSYRPSRWTWNCLLELLGGRHVAAAAVTARTAATGVVVQLLTATCECFWRSDGAGMDPDIEHGPIHIGERARRV